MNLAKDLNYKGYSHKLKEGDTATIKDIRALTSINNILIGDQEKDAYDDVNWYMTDEKMKLFSNQEFIVLNCISWHMGIPYYQLENSSTKDVVYIGEFYLNKITN